MNASISRPTDGILTFSDALQHSERHKKRHLILGNGFSIGCRAQIFHYASLFERADFSKIPDVIKVFEVLNTQDFETAIRALETGALLAPIFSSSSTDTVSTMLSLASALKDVLVNTIASNHPATPHSITEAEFSACRAFLAPFLSGANSGHVFTLNYDLLLYWTLMHDDARLSDGLDLLRNDSFGNDEDAPDAEYVVWQGETAAHSANVHFLHGALHLFDAGAELQKYTWVRKGEPLVDQARAAIAANKYPLFVAEGTSAKKKEKIRHNAYLYQSFKVLSTNADVGTHCFFIFGHSLAGNDDHILKRLGRGKFPTLYVGIFGSPDTTDNKRIIKRATDLKADRRERYPLEVKFFDSATAQVWGH
jgi:hypothetical protein